MKGKCLSAVFGIAAFVAAYLACCYLIPGWRIKLEADTLTYFWASVTHMVPLKGLISLAVGGAVYAAVRKLMGGR